MRLALVGLLPAVAMVVIILSLLMLVLVAMITMILKALRTVMLMVMLLTAVDLEVKSWRGCGCRLGVSAPPQLAPSP